MKYTKYGSSRDFIRWTIWSDDSPVPLTESLVPIDFDVIDAVIRTGQGGFEIETVLRDHPPEKGFLLNIRHHAPSLGDVDVYMISESGAIEDHDPLSEGMRPNTSIHTLGRAGKVVVVLTKWKTREVVHRAATLDLASSRVYSLFLFSDANGAVIDRLGLDD